MRNLFILASIVFTIHISAFAQNGIGINETGSSPHASSILDLSSTKAGVLVPRMTLSQRNTNISSPATGLLIYQTDNTPGFYYYNGTVWVRITDGAVTADNGLSVNTGNNVRLGGTLLVNTTVDQGTFDLLFSGSGLYGIGSTLAGSKLNISPGSLNTALNIGGFPSSSGKTGLAIDMSNTSSSNGISISNIGSSSMNGININSTANGNGTGIRLGETTTLGTGINIRGGSGIVYNALNAASGTGISIGGTTTPLNGVDASVSGAGLGGVFQSSTTGAGVFGLSISGSYSRPTLLPLTGVRGYTATNSNTGTEIAYGVFGSSVRFNASGATGTSTYGVFGSATGSATSVGNGLMVGTYGTALVSNTGTSGAIGGLFNAAAGSTNLALAASGGADVYLGSSDADRPSNFTGSTVTVGSGNLNTTRMFNSRISGTETFVGSTSGTIGITAPASVTSYSLTLPSAVSAANGNVLSSNTFGTLSWSSPGSLLTAGTGISISGNTITNTGVLTEVDPTWSNGGNQTNSISRSGVVTITRTDASNGFLIGNTGSTAGTVSTYPFLIQRAGLTDLSLGSDASFGYFQSWNNKPLLLNSQGNFIGINQTTAPVQNLDINGRLAVQNGVIQRGGTTITASNDLGLYSQINGNWIRIASNAAPIKFFTDQGGGNAAGTNALMSVDNANGGGVIIAAETSGAGNAGTPQARAALEINSTTKGMLTPRLNTSQRDAMGNSLNEGLLIYNTDTDCFEFWDTKSAPIGGNGFWNSLCEWCKNVIIINSNQTGYNLSSAIGGGRAEQYCVYILSGVTLQAAGNGGGSGVAGNSAFNANTMPAGASIKLYNYGTLLGGGGNGGQGGQESDGVCSGDANGQAGGSGGHGILTSSSVPVSVFNYGTIRAGGGGGGGGGRSCCAAGGGGGGGAGTPSGSGGAQNTTNCTSGFICGCGGSTSSPGSSGTASAGGNGGGGVNRGSTGCTCTGSGAGSGGNGGAPGVAGNVGAGSSSGAAGGAGLALQGNGSGSSITNVSGTVTGSINP